MSPETSLSDHVRILGRGPGRSRSLTQSEAADAMRLMLSEAAAPEAVGALLMLLRMKGETGEEIAGLAGAARAVLPVLPGGPMVDLDWPSYAAGRTRGAPWFLLAARLVAQAGFRVLLHGWNGADQTVRRGLGDAGIAVAGDMDAAAALLERDRIVYLPLERVHPDLFRLLQLREVLGLRSCINTVCRMLNPVGARASVQGVFHPVYRGLQAEAAARLGWDALSVIKGGGGEFERAPGKEIHASGLRGGAAWERHLPAGRCAPGRLSDTHPHWPGAAWRQADLPGFETEIVLGTAALALDTLGVAEPETRAAALWYQRAMVQASCAA